MAHFAQLDENNIVLQVVVVNNNELLNADGQEEEIRGIHFLQAHFGMDTKWVQSSYNLKFRRNHAQIGGSYDPVLDHFLPKCPYDSKKWTISAETEWVWVSPVPFPSFALIDQAASEGKCYDWDEETANWVLKPQVIPEYN